VPGLAPVPSPARQAALGAVGLVAWLVTVAVTLAGCGDRTDFADRTAVAVVGDDTVRFTVDACGLDDDTLFVVGRSTEGEVVQAVVALRDDGTTGEPAGTGLTVDVGTTTYAAFGDDAWALRRGQGPVPGSIDRAARRGARIQVGGVAELVDDDGRPAGRGVNDEVAFSFDARCDEREADRP
jgi:hypothetical protein